VPPSDTMSIANSLTKSMLQIASGILPDASADEPGYVLTMTPLQGCMHHRDQTRCPMGACKQNGMIYARQTGCKMLPSEIFSLYV
jgi:hypothetical protein